MPKLIRRKKRKNKRLTPRQLQCVVLMARGKSEIQIGRALRISDQTVHKHLEVAKKRYRVRSRIRLVVRALVRRELTLSQIAK